MDFLKELEITEGRFTQVPKILRVVKDNGLPPLEFEFDEDYSYFFVPALDASLIERNIPDNPNSRSQQSIRYCSLYSNKTRGQTSFIPDPDPEGFDQSPTWYAPEIQLADGRILVLEYSSL